MKVKSIFLDNHATTPVDPRVREVMSPYFEEAFGNPSSRTHAFGWQAEMAVENARQAVSETIGAQPKNIIFTSGATESNNLAILGCLSHLPRPVHLIVSAVEHKSVLEVADEAGRRGIEVTVLPVNEYGQVELETLKAALKPHTRLVSVMFANNEIGSINPIEQIGRLAKQRNFWLHTDATQAIGRAAIHVDRLGIDMLSLSGHKIYGPKGVGALFVRRDQVDIKPLLFGGSQEDGLRPGTHNVPGIVGLGKACQLMTLEGSTESLRLRALRDDLISRVLKAIPNVRLNGHPRERLCTNISLSFEDLPCDILTDGLHDLALSSGSACASSTGHPSHVLQAIGHSEELARATLRIGLGRFTTPEEVSYAAEKIMQIPNGAGALTAGG
jgi:cysteine desulfurase